MKPLALVFYPTSSELLVNRLLDPRAPTSPDPDALHDCKMRSSWLRSNFKSFVNHYKQDPQRFKNILLEMNYMCMTCCPFDHPYPTTRRVNQQAAQRLVANRAQKRLVEEQRAQKRLVEEQRAQKRLVEEQRLCLESRRWEQMCLFDDDLLHM